MLHHVIIIQRGARGQRPADRLDQQAGHIKRNEDEGVQVGADARQVRGEGQADVF